MREIIGELGFIEIKNFCSAKDRVKRRRKEATDLEKIFTNHVNDKELVSRIKNSQNSAISKLIAQ